jgi:3-oxoacyl-[acyl-carrier protein] reductase
MPSLSGKVAIVTGSSRGIGRGIAERLGRDGADVIVTYAGNRDKAEEVVAAIAAMGSKATAMQVVHWCRTRVWWASRWRSATRLQND